MAECLVAAGLDVGVFFFEVGSQDVFFAFAIFAVGGLVRVGAGGIAEVNARRIGPEGRVDYLDVVLGDGFGIVAVFFIVTLL